MVRDGVLLLRMRLIHAERRAGMIHYVDNLIFISDISTSFKQGLFLILMISTGL